MGWQIGTVHQFQERLGFLIRNELRLEGVLQSPIGGLFGSNLPPSRLPELLSKFYSLRCDSTAQMTARSATATLLRAVLRATAAVPAAAMVWASADLFRIPECSKATVSIPPPKTVYFSSNRSSAASNSVTTASASSAMTISSTLSFLYNI